MKRVKYVGPPGRFFPELHWKPEHNEEREVPDEVNSVHLVEVKAQAKAEPTPKEDK